MIWKKKPTKTETVTQTNTPELTPEERTEQKKKQARKDRRIIREFLLKLALVIGGVYLIFTFVFGVAQMKGEVMYPSLRDGDVMLYYRMEKTYTRGDVVCYEWKEQFRVGRIVAQGGDRVEVNENGQLLVNGSVQTEEIFFPTNAISGGIDYPYTVPEGSYFLMGDYRTAASDCRATGAIPQSDFKGKVITVLRRRSI